MAFPYEQIKSLDELVKESIEVLSGKSNKYRTIIPKSLSIYAKKRQRELWDKETDTHLGKRHPLIKKAEAMTPATTIAKGVTKRLKKVLPKFLR